MTERRTFVIQEHDAERAGLHWDLRFECQGSTEDYDSMRPVTNEPRGTGNRVLRSFVVPKHRLPEMHEKLLVIQTEDHPWEYRNFEGYIERGYGKGAVKLIHCGEIDVLEFSDTKVKFRYLDKLYTIFYVPSMKRWMITQSADKTVNLAKIRARVEKLR